MSDIEVGAEAPAPRGKARKIAIVGTADSMSEAPYEDESWEIWTMSVALTFPALKRADRYYEMHGPDYFEQDKVMERLKKVERPLYMLKEHPGLSTSVAFPKDELMAEFGNLLGFRFYTSSVAWLIAHAIYEGADYISLFGIHMRADEEYGKQLAACCYWIGIAEGRGIACYSTERSAICRTKTLYGYEDVSPLLRDLKLSINKLGAGLNQDYGPKMEQAKQLVWKQQGAIEWSQMFMKEHDLL